MSLQYDRQNLNAILEATHTAALEFLESLATWHRLLAPRSDRILPGHGAWQSSREAIY